MSTNLIYLIVIGLIFWGSFGLYCFLCDRNEKRARERLEILERLRQAAE